MKKSLRPLLLLCLAACFTGALTGCMQESNGDSTAFNDLPEVNVSPSAKGNSLVDAPATPLVAPRPNDLSHDAPLVAVKPILGSSSSDIQDKLKVGNVSPTAQREIKLLIPEKSFRTEKYRGKNLIRVSYDDFDLLKVLNMEPVPRDAADHFPSWLNELDGKRVRVRGFMYPPPKDDGLAGFLFVRDNQICCMGREPKIYDMVDVFLKDGVTTHYIPNRPFDVVGTFRVDPVADEYGLYGLYAIEDAVVIER